MACLLGTAALTAAVAAVAVDAVAAARGAPHSLTAITDGPFLVAVGAPAGVGVFLLLRRPKTRVAWILVIGPLSVAAVMAAGSVADLACGRTGARSSHLHRSSALGVGALIALALAAVALLTTAGRAASSTQMLRFYSKPALFTFTPKGGAPVHHPPAGQAKPGDELEIDSLDYAGSHSHHARQWSASDHLQCVFGAGGQPDCQGQAAVGGSLLLFAGERLVGGTGPYEGATGNVRSRDRAGGSDIVITIHPPR